MTQHLKAGSVEGLVEKLEAAEVGSRELDVAVCDALVPVAMIPRVAGYGVYDSNAYARGKMASAQPTTSLDAALALAERVVPGSGANINTFTNVVTFAKSLVHMQAETSKAATPALALCIAILKARLSLALEKEGPTDGQR